MVSESEMNDAVLFNGHSLDSNCCQQAMLLIHDLVSWSHAGLRVADMVDIANMRRPDTVFTDKPWDAESILQLMLLSVAASESKYADEETRLRGVMRALRSARGDVFPVVLPRFDHPIWLKMPKAIEKISLKYVQK